MQAVISKQLLKTIQPREKPYEIRDTRLPGFILRVQPSGYMAYVAQYGRGQRLTLGPASKLTAAQARDEAKKKLAGAALGEDPAAERKAGNAYDLESYLAEVYEPWASSHLKTGQRQVGRIRSSFPDLLSTKLGDLTPWLIEKHRSKRLKKVTAGTVNKDVGALRASLRRAVDWEILEQHPLGKVKPLKEDRRGRVRYLSSEEEEWLWAALDDREERLREKRDSGNEWRRERGYKLMPNLRLQAFADRLKPLVLLSLNTGCRRGELFNLKWPDVDSENKLMTIEGRGAKTTQTRHLPLNSEAYRVLQRWQKQATGREAYVFPADNGGRLDHVSTSWRGVLRAAKIKHFRWHDLRHSFASKLVMAGVDLNTVRELLGHSDISMTLRYSHLSPQVKAAAVEKLISFAPAT